jgi:surface carbohydrate biosynthesis protein (TIGR04326 family)
MKNTHQQINLLEKAKIFLPKDVVIIVKPHPACPIRPADYPGLKMEVTMEPLAELLPDCDVAYSSSGTSAAVDAYCSGVPIVSMLDPKMLNLSPLRGTDGVFFASTYEELAESLISAASSTCLTNRRQDFFILNAKLPRWRKLLS